MHIDGPIVGADRDVRHAYDLWITGEYPEARMVDDVWYARMKRSSTKAIINYATPDQPFEDIWEEGYLDDTA